MRVRHPGEIENLERFKQVVSFHKMVFERGISPTDFDVVIDFGGKEWVLGEVKRVGNYVPTGQKIALTRALQAHQKAGIKVLGFVCVHDEPVDQPVIVADCLVQFVWQNGQWADVYAKRQTVMDLIKEWRG